MPIATARPDVHRDDRVLRAQADAARERDQERDREARQHGQGSGGAASSTVAGSGPAWPGTNVTTSPPRGRRGEHPDDPERAVVDPDRPGSLDHRTSASSRWRPPAAEQHERRPGADDDPGQHERHAAGGRTMRPASRQAPAAAGARRRRLARRRIGGGGRHAPGRVRSIGARVSMPSTAARTGPPGARMDARGT